MTDVAIFSKDDKFALIWGASKIAELLGVTTRRCFYMLESGQLPARKIGGRWVAERERLMEFFVDDEEAA